MNVEDYSKTANVPGFASTEKGGKLHEVPAHHNAESYVDAYLFRGRDRGPEELCSL
jgi:hypothetical protein